MFHMATLLYQILPEASCFCRTSLQISKLNWVGLRLQDPRICRPLGHRCNQRLQEYVGIKDCAFPKFTHPNLILGKVRHARKPQVGQLQLLQCYDACVPSISMPFKAFKALKEPQQEEPNRLSRLHGH